MTVQRDWADADPDGTVDVREDAAPAPDVIMHKQQPPKPKAGKIPHRQGNGYYADHATGGRLRSVTTILEGGVPKKALLFWAAGVCVDSAIANLPQLVAASRFPDKLAEISAWLKRAHTQAKEERADVGTWIHKVIECHILGLDIPDEISVGEGERAHVLRRDDPELAAMLEHFEAFVAEWQVTFEASEMVVANPDDGWAGTLDYIVVSPKIATLLRDRYGFDVADDASIMGDTKSGGVLDKLTTAGHFHGVYPEAGLQLSAYRRAQVCWLKSGERVPMPPTAEVGIVLHIRPEGYRIYPARCGPELYDYFRHAQMIDQFTAKIGSPKAPRPVIMPPLNPPNNNSTN